MLLAGVQYVEVISRSGALLLMATVIGGVSWLTAVVCVIAMIQHRAPGVSVGHLLTHGLAFFSADKFTHEADRWRGWFLRAVGLFVACAIAMAVIAATL